MLFRKSAILKRVACLTLALSAVSFIPVANATYKNSPGNDTVWCNGDGTPYADIPGFPGDTLPFGPTTDPKNPDFGKNPADTWDGWWPQGTDSTLVNPPNFGEMLTTYGPYAVPAMVNDVYAIHPNYWNSIVNGNPAYANKDGYSAQQSAPFGHSLGHLCMSFSDLGYADKSKFAFVITYPASPSKPDPREVAFHTAHPDDYPSRSGFVPFVDGPTAGGPTAYVSAFKGCSWDGNSCTMGSEIPGPGQNVTASTDINKFPAKLSDISSIPTTWSISSEPYYGNPFVKDKTLHVWDASYDIWFDKTAHTAEGESPYNQDSKTHDARGQNDGLEIMVWMNSNGSYVDAGTQGQRPVENVAGLAQPTGHIRERVWINSVLYDVWVGRLNNPYFGYVEGSTTPDGKIAPPIIKPSEIAGNCPLSFGKGASGELCGIEWNVVSFVATKDVNGIDYRVNSMDVDAKAFTNYLLGVFDGRWIIESTEDGSAGTRTTPLQCPASNKNQNFKDDSGLLLPTIDCLKPDWYLTSIQAGFEPWIGGNGLKSDNFTAYVKTQPAMSALGIINVKGDAIVNASTPFNAVYSRCSTYSANNHAYFTITGSNGTSNVTYPADGTKIDMGAQDPRTKQFTYTVNDPAFPIRGNAVAHYTSACGNYNAAVFVDNTGKVFYSNGTTPVQGATVTLEYSPSGNQNGPFVAVPDANSGLAKVVMQVNGNTRNPVRSSYAGTYGWNLVPGWYRV
ncbi:MAG TPA: hypothetical protein VHL14_03495, partial [Steroidobacteraceae bacterium]|nr:hypothetical protein [Steroidobacteraceae bacterium]